MRSPVRLPLGLCCWVLLLAGGLLPARAQAQVRSQIYVNKTVDRTTAAPGDLLTYTLTFGNAGTAPATGVTISDPLPQNTRFVDTNGNGLQFADTVFWSVGDLAPGQSGSLRLQLRVNPSVAAGTRIDNTAQISSVDTPQGVRSGTASVTIAGVASPPAPLSPTTEISLAAAVDRPTAAPGEILTYTLTATNQTGGVIQNGAVFDMVPPGTQFVDASNGGQLSGDTIVWTLSSLSPGASAAVSFRVRVQDNTFAGTLIQNQAQLSVPAQGMLVTSNTITTTVASPGAGLVLAMAVDRTTAGPGDVLTYTFSFMNLGSTPVTGAEVVDQLAAGLSFVDAQANVQIDLLTRSLHFPLGNLASGASGSIAFRARVEPTVASGTAITNRATLTVPGLAQPISSNPATTTIGVSSFTGTYAIIQSFANSTAISVDPKNHFTVITVPVDGLTPGLGTQGTLGADGGFSVVDPSGRVRFVGRIDPISQTASITVDRSGLPDYSAVLPRALDFSAMPAPLVGTFSGFATNPRGDRLRVLLTIDPGGNSTFQADLIQLFPTLIRHRSGVYQVTANGLLTFGGRTDGALEPAGTTLVLNYDYITTSYQSSFQIPLVRR